MEKQWFYCDCGFMNEFENKTRINVVKNKSKCFKCGMQLSIYREKFDVMAQSRKIKKGEIKDEA
jgi:hypothetical protein